MFATPGTRRKARFCLGLYNPRSLPDSAVPFPEVPIQKFA
jgi:hypothetical protein